jgi:hypothetical protein
MHHKTEKPNSSFIWASTSRKKRESRVRTVTFWCAMIPTFMFELTPRGSQHVDFLNLIKLGGIGTSLATEHHEPWQSPNGDQRKGEFAEMEVGNQAFFTFFPFGLQFSESTITNPSTRPCKASMTIFTSTRIQTIPGPNELKTLSESTHLIEHFNTFPIDLCTCVERYFLEPT